jgi:hypothetical protein
MLCWESQVDATVTSINYSLRSYHAALIADRKRVVGLVGISQPHPPSRTLPYHFPTDVSDGRGTAE